MFVVQIRWKQFPSIGKGITSPSWNEITSLVPRSFSLDVNRTSRLASPDRVETGSGMALEHLAPRRTHCVHPRVLPKLLSISTFYQTQRSWLPRLIGRKAINYDAFFVGNMFRPQSFYLLFEMVKEIAVRVVLNVHHHYAYIIRMIGIHNAI